MRKRLEKEEPAKVQPTLKARVLERNEPELDGMEEENNHVHFHIPCPVYRKLESSWSEGEFLHVCLSRET